MQLDMTKGRPLPVILQFTLPLIIGNIFQQLYNMVDTIIVGRYVGADALAAVGSTGTIMFLLTGFSQGITAGFAILISQRYGAHDADGVKQAVANGTLLSVLFTLFLTCSCLFLMKPLLTIMNTPDNIFADAYSYIMIITAGIVANIFYNLLSAFLRAVGNSKVPLFFLVFSACLNVLLDLFFIIQLQMGVAGAAWATNLAQAISAVLCAIYIWCKIPELKPYRSDWKISRTDTKNQLAAGIPMALQFAITSSGTMIMQSAINLFGSTATYSGQNFGSGDIKRIKAGVKTALGIALVYALVVTALMCSLLKPALHLFFSGDVDMSAMLPWAQTYAYMCSMFFIPLSTIFIFRNTMQGCGYGFLPMMGGVAELLARLVVSIFAMKILNFRLACFGDPAAWIAAAVFTGISYLYVMRKIEQSHPA